MNNSLALKARFTSSTRLIIIPPCRNRSARSSFTSSLAPSKWVKALNARYRGFFWQRGYGAFSLSPSQLDAVLRYVEEQPAHHRTLTFQEEYRKLLSKHGMQFDERYVWD